VINEMLSVVLYSMSIIVSAIKLIMLDAEESCSPRKKFSL
jgi:hypothetical protein